MGGMDEFSFSTKLRDVVTKMIENTVNKLRPPDRYGVVSTIDAANLKCGVVLNGETNAILVNMGSIKPTFVGQSVRISGGQSDRYISDVFGSVQDCPIGTVVMWLTNTAPTGWLMCNGTTFNATNYPVLNTLLGGNTLPDLRSKFPYGASGTGSAPAVKSTAGAATVTLTSTELPSHTHTGVDHLHPTGSLQKTQLAGSTNSDNTGGSVVQGQAAGRFIGTQTGGTTTGAADRSLTTGATGTGSAFSILPPYYAVNFIIRGA